MNCKEHGLPMTPKYSLAIEGGTRYEYRCEKGCKEIVEDLD